MAQKEEGFSHLFKHNPYHSKDTGQFTSGDKAGYISLWGKPYAAKITADQERVQRLGIISNIRKLKGGPILVGHYAKLPMEKLKEVQAKLQAEHHMWSKQYVSASLDPVAAEAKAPDLSIPHMKKYVTDVLAHDETLKAQDKEAREKNDLIGKIQRYAGYDAKVDSKLTLHRLQDMHDTLKAAHHELLEQYGALAGEDWKQQAIKNNMPTPDLAVLIATLKKNKEEDAKKDFGKTVVQGQSHYMWETSVHPLSMTPDELSTHLKRLNLLNEEHQQMAAQYYKNYMAKVGGGNLALPNELTDWVATHFPSVESGAVRDKLKPESAASHYSLNKDVPQPKPVLGVQPVQMELWDAPLPKKEFHNLLTKYGNPDTSEGMAGAERLNKFRQHHYNLLQSLPEESKAAIKMYTGTWHSGINRSLGKGLPLSRSQASVVKKIEAALIKSSLGDDIVLNRAIPTIHLMNAFGLKAHQEITPEALVGKVYGEKGFASTTLRTDDAITGVTAAKVTAGNTMLHINAPKETHGLYIKDISQHGNEQEVLLPRGMQYLITGVSKTGGGWGGIPTYVLNVDLLTK
jgi:hypothetical protein